MTACWRGFENLLQGAAGGGCGAFDQVGLGPPRVPGSNMMTGRHALGRGRRCGHPIMQHGFALGRYDRGLPELALGHRMVRDACLLGRDGGHPLSRQRCGGGRNSRDRLDRNRGHPFARQRHVFGWDRGRLFGRRDGDPLLRQRHLFGRDRSYVFGLCDGRPAHAAAARVRPGSCLHIRVGRRPPARAAAAHVRPGSRPHARAGWRLSARAEMSRARAGSRPHIRAGRQLSARAEAAPGRAGSPRPVGPEPRPPARVSRGACGYP